MIKRFVRLCGFFYMAADKGGEPGSGGATAPVQRERNPLPSASLEGAAKRQALDVEAREAERAEAAARIERATTNSQLTTCEHAGKRTGEPDKPDHIEDAKVGEPQASTEVQVAPITRETIGPDGEKVEKVVDVAVVDQTQDHANVAGLGTANQQADRATITEAIEGGAKPVTVGEIAKETADQNAAPEKTEAEPEAEAEEGDGLEQKTVAELRDIAANEGANVDSHALKADVIAAIRAKRGN